MPWGQAWRLGADEATLLLTPVDLVFGGSVTLPAGAYTLYMMPVENGPSQLVFSRNVGRPDSRELLEPAGEDYRTSKTE